MKTFRDQLQERLESGSVITPQMSLLQENPVEFFSESYEACIADFDKAKIAAEPFSREGIISQVLKNQANFLLNEVSYTTTALPTGQDITFTTIAMPLIRKIFSRLLAMELVTVQPIAQSTAQIFYLDFLAGTERDDFEVGDSLAGGRSPDYATNRECSDDVAEVTLKMTQETIVAIEKKLKSEWSIELEQDLMAYHKLSAETELMKVQQDEIIREIDGLLIRALLAGATGSGSGTGTGAGNVNWNTTGYLSGDASTFERKEYRKTLYEAIIDASNLIFKKRYRYANWIIGHTDAIVRLEKLEEFKISEGADAYEFQVGRHLVGTLNDRFKVYKDPWFPVTNKLLLGYKYTNWLDACGFYSPYIPLYTTPKIIDPRDFKPRRGLMSRFAYGTLIKDGLSTVTLTTS